MPVYGTQDANKCITFLSLKAALRQSGKLFDEPELKGNKDQAFSYLMYLHLMAMKHVPVKLNGQGRIRTKIINQSKHSKYFDALRQYRYIQIKKFPTGKQYVWITPRGRRTLGKLMKVYEENVTHISDSLNIAERHQIQW